MLERRVKREKEVVWSSVVQVILASTMKEEVVDQTPKRMFAPCMTQRLMTARNSSLRRSHRNKL